MISPNLYSNPIDLVDIFPAANLAPAYQVNLALQLAGGYIENHCQRILVAATYSHEQMPLIVNRNNQLVGKVRQWPINGVSALSFLPMGVQNVSTNEIPLDVTYVDFMSPPERLFFFSGPIPQQVFRGYGGRGGLSKSLKGVVFATYTAGFTVIPQDIRLASVLLGQYFLSRNANSLGAASISVGAPSSSNSVAFGKRSTLLDDAEKLLDAYVRRE